MLDSIFKTIGTKVVNSLVEKTGITSEQAVNLMPMAQNCLQNGFTEQITSGNPSAITNLFNETPSSFSNNPLFSGIKNNLIGQLTSNMNLPEAQAGEVAGTGLTNIVSQISEMTKGEGGTVDENTLMDKLGLSTGIGDNITGAVKNKLNILF